MYKSQKTKWEWVNSRGIKSSPKLKEKNDELRGQVPNYTAGAKIIQTNKITHKRKGAVDFIFYFFKEQKV